MTGTTWLDERGLLDGPILITNTHSVGVARDAAVEWMVDKGWPALRHAPLAAETYDGFLNDINGFHVTKKDVMNALRTASAGPVKEGSVGGGTGMICNAFKAGNGTSSRLVTLGDNTYTVGVFVQCNYGRRPELITIAGVPVPELQDAAKIHIALAIAVRNSLNMAATASGTDRLLSWSQLTPPCCRTN